VSVKPFLDKSAYFALLTVIALMPLMGHAGGLGVAPLVFILGVLGVFLSHQKMIFKITPVFMALAAFLTWLCISAIWSPYRPDDLLTNYLKLLIMVIVFYFAVPVFSHIEVTHPGRVRHLVMATTLMGAGLIVIDLLTHYGLTLLFTEKADLSGSSRPLADAEMNIGHGITVLVLISAPVALLMKTHLKYGGGIAASFLGLIGVASWLGGLSVGLLGLMGVLGAGALAYNFPKFIPQAFLISGIILILGSPAVAYFADQIMINGGLDIPLSWEHRLRMWAYCWPVIAENPLTGLGFDSARTFAETFKAPDGRDITIVSLHPHNAGIHIWTETGIIGALLACLVLFLLLKPVKLYAQTPVRSSAVSGVIIATIIISSVTYGAWQFWWWASVFFTIGILHILPTHKIKKAA